MRRGLNYDVNPDDTALALPGPPPAHLRSGADITLHLTAGPLRILAVHLKTGCQRDPLATSHRAQCKELAEQLPPLQAWIAARKAEGGAFIVLGDFNRWMDGKDQLIAGLNQAAPLLRATEGVSSPCWGGEKFIDHILAGGAAAQWMQPATLSVLMFRETGVEWKDRLSDHCAVSVRFRPPG